MDFEQTEDQSVLLASVDALLSQHRSEMPGSQDYFLRGDQVRAKLESEGFLDIVREGFSALDAVLLIERVAEMPQALEIGATMLVAPMLGLEKAAGAIACVEGRPGGHARFLDTAAGVFVETPTDIRYVLAHAFAVESVQSLYAYPFGKLIGNPDLPDGVNVDPCAYWTWRYVAQAAEVLGAVRSAIRATVEHVSSRIQFGRPLGALQVVQHRLAQAAALESATRLLVYRAAASGRLHDAVTAVTAAKEAATLVCYEAQQFHGAIGLSLEHPVHCWTYRLRVLIGEGGGPTAIGHRHAGENAITRPMTDGRSIFETI